MTQIATGDNRRGRSVLAAAQWMAIGLGVIFLGWYVVARGHSHFASEIAIDEFRSGRAGAVKVVPIDPGRSSGSPEPPVDTSLWSEGRIEAYRQTLLSDPRAVLAVLSIPRLDLEVPVFDGTDDWVLDRGAGRIEGTSLPGLPGNIGIAAHRDGFFRVLQDIAVGDTVILETSGRTINYSVESLEVVEPTEVSVLEPTAEPTVTLVTCFPFYFVGSAPQRFIVRAAGTQAETEM